MSSKKMTKYSQERMILKHKPRKILNLEERVQAIRMYDELPVYQRVASAFQCSWEQIKTIVANRQEILQYYASCQIIDKSKDDGKVIRHKKINFLGNCMYEYIKRAHHYRLVHITDEVIRERALEFRDLIKIEKFFPNRAWINDFKSVFNIDLEHINRIIITRKPQRSLSCKDIINYCSKEVDEALASKPSNAKTQESDFQRATDVRYGNAERPSTCSDNDLDGEFEVEDFDEDDDEVINEHEEGPTIDFSNYAEDLDEEILKTTHDHIPPTKNSKTAEVNSTASTSTILRQILASKEVKQEKLHKVDSERSSNTSSPTQQNATKRSHTSTSTIYSYQEALDFMRPLEDYALTQEDFRAINLLTQLSQHYEKSMKRRRFN